MASRLVPARKPRVCRPQAIRLARVAMARHIVRLPVDAKVKASKRRGTVFATFCKIFFAKNTGGGYGRLQAAALAWSALTPRQKAQYAERTSAPRAPKQQDTEQQTPVCDGLQRPVPARVPSFNLNPTECSATAQIRVGHYTVVEGQRAIGSGSYGHALEVEHFTGRRMAMKLFHDVDLGLSELGAYRDILRATQNAMVCEAACPFLNIEDFCTKPPLMWMTMPLIAGGDLWRQMKSRMFGRREVAAIMFDAWSALQFLHEKAGILHLDVKPQNMLWTGTKLFIIDFSLWERWPVPAGRRLYPTYCTSGFRPPELDTLTPLSQEQLHKVVRPAVDWWSLGCTGAYLAWSTTAVFHKRPQIRTDEWASREVRDRHLERVSPIGTYLRPVLENLLDQVPTRRRMGAEWFRDMKEGAHIPPVDIDRTLM